MTDVKDGATQSRLFSEASEVYLGDINSLDPYKQQYRKYGFVQIPDVVRGDVLESLASSFHQVLFPQAERLQGGHREERGVLSPGGCYYRFDDAHPEILPSRRRDMAILSEKSGLTGFGQQLGATVTPLVRFVTDGEFTFDRAFVLFYEEGDYISLHNDRQSGLRVNVQFPCVLGSVSGTQILEDGILVLHYDVAGYLRVLGPEVWHAVPPLLKVGQVMPHRVTEEEFLKL